MVKRFLIAAIIVGLFLGGVGYFNLVFKPKMIGEFMAKMVPPPATVTAEAARTERWIDRVRAIGTLVAIEGVDVTPQIGGLVTDYYFDSGQDVEKGQKLVKLDTSVEEADLADHKATLVQTNLDLERHSRLVKTSAVSQAALDATLAKRDSAAALFSICVTCAQVSSVWRLPDSGRFKVIVVTSPSLCLSTGSAMIFALRLFVA